MGFSASAGRSGGDADGTRGGRFGGGGGVRPHRRGARHTLWRGFRGALTFILAATLLATLAVGLAQQRLRQGPVSLGPAVAALIADRLTAGAEGLVFSIGDAVFSLGEPGRPSGLRLRQVQAKTAAGTVIASAPELTIDFRVMDLLQGRLAPTRVELIGAQATLLRDAQGRLRLIPADLSVSEDVDRLDGGVPGAPGVAAPTATPGQPGAQAKAGDAPADGSVIGFSPKPEGPPPAPPPAEPGLAGFVQLLDQAEAGKGPLGQLRAVSATDTTMVLRDEVTGQLWRLVDADLEISVAPGITRGALTGQVLIPRQAGAEVAPDAGPSALELAIGRNENALAALTPATAASLDPGMRAALGLGDGAAGADGAGVAGVGPRVSLRGSRDWASGDVRIGISFADLPLSQLTLAPGLAALQGADSRAVGEMEADVAASGELRSLSLELKLGPGRVGDAPAPFDRIDGAEAKLDWRADRGVARIERLSLSGPAGAVALSGEATPHGRGVAVGAPEILDLDLNIDQLDLAAAAGLPRDLTAAPGRLQAVLLPNQRRAEISRFVVAPQVTDGEAPRIEARGAARLTDAGPELAFAFEVPPMSVSEMLRAWPIPAAPGARIWLDENVLKGQIEGAVGAFWWAPGEKPEMTLDFAYSDLDAILVPQAPELTDGAGAGRVTLSRMDLSVESGQITPPGGQPVDFAGSRFVIPDVLEAMQRGQPELRARGRIADMLNLVDQPPFRLISKMGAPLGPVQGQATLRAGFDFPLRADLEADEIVAKVEGRMTGLGLRPPGADVDLTDGDMRLEADESHAAISGQGRIDGMPATLSWRQDFSAGAPDGPSMTVKLSVTQPLLDKYGIGDIVQVTEGAASATIEMTEGRGPGASFRVDADLGPAALLVPDIGWAKGKGKPGELTVEGSRGGGDQGVDISLISLESQELSLRGSAELSPEGDLRKLDASRLVYDGVLDLSADLSRARNGTMKVAVRGKLLDVGALTRRRDGMALAGAPPQEMSAAAGEANSEPLQATLEIDTVRLVEGVALTGAKGELTSRAGQVNAQLSGAVNGGGQARMRYRDAPNGDMTVSLRSDDAGRLLDDLDVTDEARGGRLSVRARLPKGEEALVGQAVIENIRVGASAPLADVVQRADRDGLLSQGQGPGRGPGQGQGQDPADLTAAANPSQEAGLSPLAQGQSQGQGQGQGAAQPSSGSTAAPGSGGSEGWRFSRIDAPFRLVGRTISVQDAVAAGPMLGLKVDGDYDMDNGALDLRGVLTPAYAVNSLLNQVPIIGELLGGKGEGLFGMNFTVTGTASDPVISTNPLSILAPGLLRRIFQGGENNPDAPPDLFDDTPQEGR